MIKYYKNHSLWLIFLSVRLDRLLISMAAERGRTKSAYLLPFYGKNDEGIIFSKKLTIRDKDPIAIYINCIITEISQWIGWRP